MIKFCDELYMTDSLKPKLNSIKLKLISGIGLLNVFVISFSSNRKDVFDIHPAYVFKQRKMRTRDMVVLGIADSQNAAFELISEMINECFEKTGSYYNIRNYFENKFERR